MSNIRVIILKVYNAYVINTLLMINII